MGKLPHYSSNMPPFIPEGLRPPVRAGKKKVSVKPVVRKQLTQEELKELYIKNENKKIDNLIKEYQDNINQMSKEQSKIVRDSSGNAKWNDLDDQIGFYRRQIKNLELGRKHIREGATFESITSYAVSKSEAELANLAIAEEAGFSSVWEMQKYNQQQRVEASEWEQAERLAGKIQLGEGKRYDPRSSVGKKINAFLDTWRAKGYTTKPSGAISLENVNSTGGTLTAYKNVLTGEMVYQSMRPEIASQKGLTPIEVYSNTLKPTGTSTTNLFFKNPQLFPKPLKGVDKIKFKLQTQDTYSTGGRTYFLQNGEVKSVKGGKDSLARFFETRVLGSDPSLTPKPEYKTGDEFSLRYAGMYFGKFFGDKATDKYDLGVLEKPAPSWLTDIASEYPTFAFFSPMMKTATAQQTQSEYVYDYQKQRFVKKSDVEKILNTPEVSGKNVKYGKSMTYQTKAERVKMLIRNLKNPNDPKAIDKVLNVVKQNYGKDFVDDFIRQEGINLVSKPTTSSVFSLDKVTTPTPAQAPTPYTGLTPVNLERVGEVGVIASAFKPEQTGETQWKDDSQTSPLFNLPKQDTDTKQDTKQDTDTKQDVRQESSLFNIPKLSQETLQQPAQKPIQQPISLIANPPKLDQPTKQRPLTRETPSIFEIPQPQRPEEPLKEKPKKPIGLFFWGDKPTYRKASRTGYQASYLKDTSKGKPKWIPLNPKNRPLSRRGALDVGSRFVDENLSARFKIDPIMETKTIRGKKKSVLKVFTKALGQGDGYFGGNRYKFRGNVRRKGKTIPTSNQFIEKKRYRLDKPKEKKQIRRASMSSFLIPQMPQARKKPKRRKSGSATSFFRL